MSRVRRDACDRAPLGARFRTRNARLVRRVPIAQTPTQTRAMNVAKTPILERARRPAPAATQGSGAGAVRGRDNASANRAGVPPVNLWGSTSTVIRALATHSVQAATPCANPVRRDRTRRLALPRAHPNQRLRLVPGPAPSKKSCRALRPDICCVPPRLDRPVWSASMSKTRSSRAADVSAGKAPTCVDRTAAQSSMQKPYAVVMAAA
jgi:hypothetical protein